MTKNANLVRRSQRAFKRGIRAALLASHAAPLNRAVALARAARTIRTERLAHAYTR